MKMNTLLINEIYIFYCINIFKLFPNIKNSGKKKNKEKKTCRKQIQLLTKKIFFFLCK